MPITAFGHVRCSNLRQQNAARILLPLPGGILIPAEATAKCPCEGGGGGGGESPISPFISASNKNTTASQLEHITTTYRYKFTLDNKSLQLIFTWMVAGSF